ncbi:MAG: homoserine dehydrogenase [Clostridiales bacterium]|jgi:homoserine dehydrogenase|nr:homoserine dehydrogenase [Clostridiales bacterium]
MDGEKIKVGAALLGVGVVGGGTYKIITEQREKIKKIYGVDLTVRHILERDKSKTDALGVDPSIVSTDIENVLNDDGIQVVAEFFGGTEPAKTFLIKCLMKGKSVVTSNKELVCKHFAELEDAARIGGGGLYFEASCVGGVPIVRTLTDAMQANDIREIKGIINGTTNYILSRMANDGTDYADALKTAQKLGYAEADPTADTEGYDAAYKLSILSSLAYNKRVPIDKIFREGINNVAAEDINFGKEFGMTLKLLGISKSIGGKIEARVHPAFIGDNHPLASVKGSFNAVYLKGNNVGDIMLYGRGAGDLPTGSAIVSDMVFASVNTRHRRYPFINETVSDGDFISNFSSKYYIRMKVTDKAGTLSKISGIFGRFGVSITTVLQKPPTDESGIVSIIFITHITNENAISEAVKAIKDLESVAEISNVIRVEE